MADAKIISYGKDIGAGTTVIPDNQSTALDIESTDAKDYITIDTTDGSEVLTLKAGGSTATDGENTPKQLQIDSAGTVTIGSTEGDISIGGASAKISFARAGGVAITAAHASGSLYFQTGGSNNRLGISADGKFSTGGETTSLANAGGCHFFVGNSGIAPANLSSGAKDIIIESAGAAGISIISGSASYDCSLNFGRGTNNGNAGWVYYNNATNYMMFGTNNAERVRIDSAGKVGINTTSAAAMLETKGNLTTALAGHLDSASSGTSLVGDGTDFLTELEWGSPIKITTSGGTETFTIVGIASNTAATLDSSISGTPSDGSSMFTDPPAFHFKTGDNQDLFKVINPMSFHLGANVNTGLKVGHTVFPNDENGQSENTGFGTNLGSALTGNTNVLVGQSVLPSATGASNGNVCMGRMIGTASTGVKSDNTIMGSASGTALTTADHNCFFGKTAGNAVTSGSQNISIGSGSDCAATVNNQIAIGYGSITDGVNKMRLGNATLATADIKVDWTVDSDERIKENVQDADAGLGFVNALRPVSFTRKHPADWPSEIREKIYTQGALDVDEEGNETWRSTPQFDVDTQQPIKDEFDDTSRVDGLLAQEVKAAAESSGVSFNGVNEAANGKLGIQYATLVVPLIKAVQELTARIEVLENGE